MNSNVQPRLGRYWRVPSAPASITHSRWEVWEAAVAPGKLVAPPAHRALQAKLGQLLACCSVPRPSCLLHSTGWVGTRASQPLALHRPARLGAGTPAACSGPAVKSLAAPIRALIAWQAARRRHYQGLRCVLTLAHSHWLLHSTAGVPWEVWQASIQPKECVTPGADGALQAKVYEAGV